MRIFAVKNKDMDKLIEKLKFTKNMAHQPKQALLLIITVF